MSDTPETAPEAEGAEPIAAPPAPEPVVDPQPLVEPAADTDREGARHVSEWWEHFA